MPESAGGSRGRSVPAAGFRQINTVVRRMGDCGDYYFDGSWKSSSFANPPGYLDADERSPWTKTLNWKPRCGLTGPPALWPIDHITQTPAVGQDAIFADLHTLRGRNIPGYLGYIPGKRAETVYGSIRAGINHYCENMRQSDEKDVSTKPLLYKNATIGKKSLGDILKTSDMKYTTTYGGVTPDKETNMKYVLKDHEIPPRGKPNTTSPGILSWSGFRPEVSRSLDSRNPQYYVRGGLATMPGYTGYRSGAFGTTNSPPKTAVVHE